jgi:hypothetical protein
MVEPQIVVLVVAGSSPVGHPIKNFRFSISDFRFATKARKAKEKIDNRKSAIENFAVSVAQPDRASDFGSEGCGFESLQARSSGSLVYSDHNDLDQTAPGAAANQNKRMFFMLPRNRFYGAALG